MPYATQDDLQQLRRLTPKQLLQLTTDSGATEPDTDVIANALTDASAVIDSYCGQRYQLPLQASRMIVVCTVDIGVYMLHGGTVLDEKAPAAVRYREAIGFLRDVSAGKASLDQPDAPADPQLASGEVITPARRQTFGEDCCFDGFI